MVDAVADDQGRWRGRSFRKMTFVCLYLSHPDFVPDGQTPRVHGSPGRANSPAPTDDPLAALHNFSDVQVMTRGVSISGQVRDDAGQPLAEAEVGWAEGSQEQMFFANGLPTTIADPQGRFSIPHVRPGRLTLQVKAKGRGPALQSIEARDGLGPLTITAPAPRTLEGRVADVQGRPIDGVFVTVDTWRGLRTLRTLLQTDAEGKFRWDEAPAELVQINASRTGFKGIAFRTVSAEDGEARIVLRRALHVDGSLRDATTGKRIEQAIVEVGVPDPRTGLMVWREEDGVSASSGDLQAGIDAEGRSEVRIRLRAPGYETYESRTFRTDEGSVIHDVALKPVAGP